MSLSMTDLLSLPGAARTAVGSATATARSRSENRDGTPDRDRFSDHLRAPEASTPRTVGARAAKAEQQRPGDERPEPKPDPQQAEATGTRHCDTPNAMAPKGNQRSCDETVEPKMAESDSAEPADPARSCEAVESATPEKAPLRSCDELFLTAEDKPAHGRSCDLDQAALAPKAVEQPQAPALPDIGLGWHAGQPAGGPPSEATDLDLPPVLPGASPIAHAAPPSTNAGAARINAEPSVPVAATASEASISKDGLVPEAAIGATAAIQAPVLTPATASASDQSPATPTDTQSTAPAIAVDLVQRAIPRDTMLPKGSSADLAEATAEIDNEASLSTSQSKGAELPASTSRPASAPALPTQSTAAAKAAAPKTDGVETIQASMNAEKSTASPPESGRSIGEAGERSIGDARPRRGSVPETGFKPAFANWISDFAASQGAIHRSGDLVGGLDRLTGTAHAATSGETLRPTPVQMLPIEIGMQALRGASQFQIRLDPDELGRVDVKLQIHESGEVEASLVVDRVETLALLKRDASTLQQAFEQAGLRQSPDGLQFSLRGENQNGQQGGRSPQPTHQTTQSDENAAVQNQISEITMRRMMIPNSSIDRII